MTEFDEAAVDAMREEAFFEAADLADEGFPEPPEDDDTPGQCVGCGDPIPLGGRLCEECDDLA